MSTTTTAEHVVHLDEAECWGRLRGAQVGRLAFEGRHRAEIVPLNYVLGGRTLLFRTAAGAAMLTPQRRPVAFEIDGWSTRTAWSVIAHGELRRSHDPEVSARQGETGIDPWAPDERGPRATLVELKISTISGREFPRRARPGALWYW
jgi:nitroimidazol reductase NimA-like FMN-containing flavoprotein (pyridoxamine 5'-phosphate oxidase superfamily)